MRNIGGGIRRSAKVDADLFAKAHNSENQPGLGAAQVRSATMEASLFAKANKNRIQPYHGAARCAALPKLI